MKSDQYLIFASTGAIAEGSGSRPFCESDTPNVQLLDCLSSSLLARERMAARRANATDYRGPVLVALRFGSVVGTSPVQRMESAHVAMTRHAMLRGEDSAVSPRDVERLPVHPRPSASNRDHHADETAVERGAHSTCSTSCLSTRGSGKLQAKLRRRRELASWHSTTHRAWTLKGSLCRAPAMESTFGFQTEWTPRRVAEDLADHLRFLSRDHLFPAVASSPPAHRCRVCAGEESTITVLNLGDLPSGDCFRPTADEALKCPRRPLKYTQCRKCGHIQLASSSEAPAQPGAPTRCNDDQLSTAHYETVLAHAVGAMPAANTSKRSVSGGFLRRHPSSSLTYCS